MRIRPAEFSSRRPTTSSAWCCARGWIGTRTSRRARISSATRRKQKPPGTRSAPEPDLPAYVQALEPAEYKSRPVARWLTVEPQHRQTREQRSEQHLELEPRELHAEAEVHTCAEREMPVGRTCDVELVRPVERLRVAIGRPVQEPDLLAPPQLVSAILHVLEHVSMEELQRRVVPQHLVEGGREPVSYTHLTLPTSD